jgi:hypothetical protein
VTLDGETYLATASSTGVSPASLIGWALLARKGENGLPGADGDDGTDGADGVALTYEELVGDGATLEFTVTHGLGSDRPSVEIYRVSDGLRVEPKVRASSSSVVVVTFGVAPTTDQYEVMVKV